MKIKAGPGRVLIELSTNGLQMESSEEYGQGRALAIDTAEWTKAVVETGTIVDVFDFGVESIDQSKMLPAFRPSSKGEGFSEYREMIDSFNALQFKLEKGMKVFFAYQAYIDWREFLGDATDSLYAADINYLSVNIRDIVAIEEFGKFIGVGDHVLVDISGKYAKSHEDGVYLSYRGVLLPLVYKTLAGSSVSNVFHLPARDINARYTPR